MTDPLLSATGLSVVHDGASFARIERTAVVAKSDIALQTLHVCWQDFSHGNCSRCQKCLRTMAALDLLGARERAVSFDWSDYSPSRLARVWLTSVSDAKHFIEIAEVAARLGRNDIFDAAVASLSFSKRKRSILGLINSNRVLRATWQKLRRLRTRSPSLARSR